MLNRKKNENKTSFTDKVNCKSGETYRISVNQNQVWHWSIDYRIQHIYILNVCYVVMLYSEEYSEKCSENTHYEKWIMYNEYVYTYSVYNTQNRYLYNVNDLSTHRHIDRNRLCQCNLLHCSQKTFFFSLLLLFPLSLLGFWLYSCVLFCSCVCIFVFLVF